MFRNIVLKTLYDRRRSLLFWCIGFILMGAILLAFFPVIRDAPFISE